MVFCRATKFVMSGINLIRGTHLSGCIKVVGSGGSATRVQKFWWLDANKCYRFTNSGKIALPESVKNVSVYISSFQIKFQIYFFFLTWAVTEDHAAPWSGIKLQIEWL